MARRLLSSLLVAAAYAQEMPWDKEILERETEKAEPCIKELRNTHGLHPGMVLDAKVNWLIKKALGGECYNMLFDVETKREESRPAKMRRSDPSFRCTEPYDPPEEVPEEGWAFWYPQTLPSEKKREEVIKKRLELEPARAKAGNPVKPPKDYNPLGDPTGRRMPHDPLDPLKFMGRKPPPSHDEL